jgi:hypothetical protein
MKRIILLLDGMWNDCDFSKFDTNIAGRCAFVPILLLVRRDRPGASLNQDWYTRPMEV